MLLWGPYWKEGQRGYKCCHSLFKSSYCTGEDGKESANSEECIVKNNWRRTCANTSNPHGDASGIIKRGEKEAAAVTEEQVR